MAVLQSSVAVKMYRLIFVSSNDWVYVYSSDEDAGA